MLDKVDKVDKTGVIVDNPVLESAPYQSQYRSYCFTLNNYEVDKLDSFWQDLVGSGPTHLVWGQEVGASGTPHLQGYIKFKNAKTLGKMRKLLPKCHITVCKGDAKANYAYCTKDAQGIRSHGFPKELDDPMEGITLKGWQVLIEGVLSKKPHPRKILWFWESTGNVGKTTYAKHLCLKRHALYVSGKANDIKSAIATMDIKPEIIIFGVPKEHSEYVSYAALEQVKDGIFFNGKYESGMVMYNIPHVIVFANMPPDFSSLSADRWDVHDINEMKNYDF